MLISNYRSSHQSFSVKKLFLEISQIPLDIICARDSFLIKFQALGLRAQACNFIKKECLAQVFSCEFCEISKNTFSTEHIFLQLISDHQETYYLMNLYIISLNTLFQQFLKKTKIFNIRQGRRLKTGITTISWIVSCSRFIKD